jgi:hypothetical protein
MLNDMVAVRLHRFPACIRAISIFTVISELCSQSPARKPLSAGNRVGYAALPERHNASAIAFVIPREAVFLQAANGVYKLGGKKRLGKEGIAERASHSVAPLTISSTGVSGKSAFTIRAKASPLSSGIEKLLTMTVIAPSKALTDSSAVKRSRASRIRKPCLDRIVRISDRS